MNTVQDSGLSARQETSPRAFHHGRSILFGLLTVAAVIGASCRQDTRGQDRASLQQDSLAVSDSTNQPNVKIQVNRKYDDKGNLVAFDSTYSTFYSNADGDTLQMDSLMKSFDAWFGDNHSTSFDRQFNSLFFGDSLRYPDFFHDDFFMKRYELNDQYLRDMMQRMDSIKNQFYRESKKSHVSRKET
jgi:hypothetical protein